MVDSRIPPGQAYVGRDLDVTVWPEYRPRDLFLVAMQPTREDVAAFLKGGEQSAWPQVGCAPHSTVRWRSGLRRTPHGRLSFFCEKDRDGCSLGLVEEGLHHRRHLCSASFPPSSGPRY